MYRSEKAILVILFVLLVGTIIYFINEDKTAKATKVIPLTTEQQQIVSELRMAQPGDIIVINETQVVHVNGPNVVRDVHVDFERAPNNFTITLKPVGMTTITDEVKMDDLARMKVRIVKFDSPEWTRVMRDYFAPPAKTDSLTQ